MATGGYGDYDDATASQDWTGYYPTSSEDYSSSYYPEQSYDPTYQDYYEAPESHLASGDVGGLAQQTTAPQYSWTSQSGQATTVRASLRPAAPRPGARQQLPPQGGAESYAKMVLQQQLRLTDEVSTAYHPSANAQYQQYYEGELGDYGQVELNASTSVARGSAPVMLRPRIPSAAAGSRLAMARPRGAPGATGWPATRAMSPRMRPALNQPPVSAFGAGARGAARPVAPGMRTAGPGIRAAGPGIRAAGPGIRAAGPGIRAAGFGVRAAGPGIGAAGPGIRAAGPGIRSAGPGVRTALAPRGTAAGARGMPAARGAAGIPTTLRTAGAGPTRAQAPRAGTSLGPGPLSLMGMNVRQPASREPSAFESRLTKFAESSCDELGISKTTDPFGSQDGDKTDSKAEASAINVEEEEEDDEEDDDDADPNCCKICDLKFEKSQGYHVHIRSTSHHQKVEAMKKAKKALAGSSETPSSTASAPPGKNPAVKPSPGTSETAKKGEHFCYVCNFLFSNAEMFNSHLTGMLHVQRLEEQKTSKQSAVDEEEGDEDSQDSVMVTAFKKNDWKSVSERDLNPDDIGKPGSAQFLCDVCNISCTGHKSYEMHIVGSKHLKKLKKAKEIEEFEKKKQEGSLMVEDSQKSKKKRKVLRIQETLDQCSDPLIGLDYMTEFQMEDATVEPRYICDLCQCKMDMRQVIPHVSGIKHRQKYFKYHSVREYNILWDIRRKSEKVKAAAKFAEETEAREGRHKMRLKIQLKAFEAEEDKAKDSEEWLELEDAHSRPKSSLPGLGGFNERSALYKDVSEYEEEEDNERDEGPVLDVDALRRIDPPPPVGLSRGRGAMYQPPPPTRFRPGAPISRPPGLRPPGLRPLGSRPPGPQPPGPPRPSYPSPTVAPRLPAARGYPPERRRAPMGASDPYYQRYPGYNSRYDYYYPTPPTSSLESRAVINYDHQSLTKDGDDYGAGASSTESPVARHEPDHYGKRPAGYEEERRVSVERSQNSAATDEDSTISGLNIDLVKAAIAQCNIDTEADAEIALQISNSLTQALLEYRLNSLAKAGTSDAALEQHLKNLRQQNAEHLTTGRHPETSNLMYSALRATRALAAKLPSGDQETIKQAMSVLDAVNLQLYGMLDKGGDSANSEDSQQRQETAVRQVEQQRQETAVRQVEQQRQETAFRQVEQQRQQTAVRQVEQQASRETHTDRFSGYEQRDEGTSGEYRQMGNPTTIRPPSKRFRFGL